MSGTSLDGLDICLTEYGFPQPEFKIIKAETIPYSVEWQKRLRDSIWLSGEELCKLDTDYGFFLGESVNDFIKRNQIKKVDFIASHGHTVFHNPNERYTLQIGNGFVIFEKTGIKTIYNFRIQDVAFGGQGAPLVPIGDEMLFGKYDACLNIGGFSNISFKRDNKRMAFDICPVNVVLNRLTQLLEKPFDDKGEIAASGKINELLLDKLNQLDYYKSESPKSLGIEWCNKQIFPLFNKSTLKTADLISTFTAHISKQIATVLNQYQIKNVLISGGGAYNSFLIHSIQSITETEIIIPERNIIEYKESLIFGWMGLLKLKNQINVLSAVTGSKIDHSSGIVIG